MSLKSPSSVLECHFVHTQLYQSGSNQKALPADTAVLRVNLNHSIHLYKPNPPS